MTNYVLSTGEITTKVERYVVDLIRMAMCVYPGDVPGRSFGFDFILGDVKKDQLRQAIIDKATDLIGMVRKFCPSNIGISLTKVQLISYSLARITISVENYGETELDIKL
jgi:hypothetical protein